MALYLLVGAQQQMSRVGGTVEQLEPSRENYRGGNGVYLGENRKSTGKRNPSDKRVVQRGCRDGKMEFVMHVKNVDPLM